MATGAGGYYTNGVTVATQSQIAPTLLVAADTEAADGAAPQTFAVPLGLIGQGAQTTTGITAHAGGGQASATQLTAGFSVVETVASANDSVKLPVAIAGQWCVVVNADASDSMQVFGYGSDTINGVATGTGVAQAAGKTALYICVVSSDDANSVVGVWYRLLSA